MYANPLRILYPSEDSIADLQQEILQHPITTNHILFPPSPSGPPLNFTEGPLRPNYVVFTFTLFFTFVGVLGNFVVIITFSSTPKLRNQTGLCMINLAIADFIIGVFYLCVSLPCSLHGDCLIISSHPICLGAVIISYTSYGAGFCSLAVVSLNRAFLISRPLQYKSIFTKKRILAILIGIWMFSLSITLGFTLSKPHTIKFDAAYYNCGLAADDKDAWPYSYIINILGFLIPVAIATACS
ncbi:melatonin receptor type 1A-like [Lytechinus variegatus]|uniref:melatonin receptor type 1A-like n=1 Tax=Lytechinus variegatus TaxID=7654 RepID=UPI001BB1F902|nr:melatonin receptor type 1A-like [Lytechinus variegatus]